MLLQGTPGLGVFTILKNLIITCITVLFSVEAKLLAFSMTSSGRLDDSANWIPGKM